MLVASLRRIVQVIGARTLHLMVCSPEKRFYPADLYSRSLLTLQRTNDYCCHTQHISVYPSPLAVAELILRRASPAAGIAAGCFLSFLQTPKSNIGNQLVPVQRTAALEILHLTATFSLQRLQRAAERQSHSRER